MKGTEFLRKVEKLAKEKGIKVELIQRRGRQSQYINLWQPFYDYSKLKG